MSEIQESLDPIFEPSFEHLSFNSSNKVLIEIFSKFNQKFEMNSTLHFEETSAVHFALIKGPFKTNPQGLKIGF